MISKSMPPKYQFLLSGSHYPIVLLPLFLITSYYFYQINMYVISEIYILLYIPFLLSYIYVKHWIIPSIFNFLPGLIPGLMTYQLAALANQPPSVGLWFFIVFVALGVVAGFSLRNALAGDRNAKLLGGLLVIVLIVASVGVVADSRLSPIDWVAAIYLISPFYFMTSVITQQKHSEYKGSQSSISSSRTGRLM
jgi:hypothetical protein